MPIGPYENFGECVRAQKLKGHDDESARNICGELEQRAGSVFTDCLQEMQQQGYTPEEARMRCEAQALSTAAQTQIIKAANDKLYVKAFLLDTTININSWQITAESIQRNINSFIGKPLVLTEDFDHPMTSEIDSLQHWLAYQESFRVGTIIDIVSKPNPTTGATVYYAIIEVTDDNLKQALRDNSIPIYVSPAIAEDARSVRPDGIITQWTGVHLSVVSEPAYGIKKAVISDTCGGDKAACMLQLRKAHIQKHGNSCGFCTKQALEKYAIIQRYASSYNNNRKSSVVIDTSPIISTGENSRGYSKNKMSQLEPAAQSDSTHTNNNANAVTQPTNAAQQAQEIIKTEQNKQAIKFPEYQDKILQAPLQEVYAENQRLKSKNAELERFVKELTNVKDTLVERVGGLEKINRRIALEQIISREAIPNEKERLERIDYYTNHSDRPLDELKDEFQRMAILARKASVNRPSSSYGGKVPYGVSSSSGSTASSPAQSIPYGSSNDVDIEGQEKVSRLRRDLQILRGGF